MPGRSLSAPWRVGKKCTAGLLAARWFYVDSGGIKDNPARATAEEPATLTEAGVERLRTALPDRTETLAQCDHLIFELLLGTGIRLGLLVGLNVGDVDLKAGTLQIRAKGGGQERVFLNPMPVRMLGRFLREVAPQGNGGPQAPLFRSRWGTRLGPRPIQLRFAALCRKTGITRRVSIHSIRHTFATRGEPPGCTTRPETSTWSNGL